MSSQKESSEITPLQKLESIRNEDMERWQRILMPNGTDGMVIGAIVVSPSHQSRGVGPALIRWGTAQADRAGFPCWVHASEAGY